MCLSKEGCFSFITTPRWCWLSNVWFQWTSQLSIFSHLLAFPALTSSVFTQHPHTACCGHWKHSHETPHCEVFSLAAELALCRDHYIFTSCHCYHGKERKSSVFRKLHCSHFPVLPSHLTVAMETGRMSMTALCVRHAGRGDVMCFSPPLWLSLCCVRGSQLQHHWSTRHA